MRFAPFNEPLILRSLQELFNISAAGDIEKGKVSNIKTDFFCYPIIGNALTNGGLYGYTDSWKQNNSITVTGRGEIGVAVERPYKYYPIVRLLTLKPKSKSDLKYFECLINSHKILNESTGVPQLTTPQIGKQKYYIVAYEEQRVIGDLFREIDERIETQNKIIEKYESLMNPILDGLLKTCDCDCFSLKDIALTKKGEQVNNNFLLDNGFYPMLNGGISFSGYYDKFNRSKNTIAISEGGNSCGYVSFVETDFWAGGHCYTIHPKNMDNSFNYYLFCFLKSKESKIMSLRVGSGLPNIQKKDLENFNVRLPKEEDIASITKVLKTLNKKIEIEKILLARFISLKTYLLSNLFI